MKEKVVICWSGGLDSTSLIALQRNLGCEIYPLFINRGQTNYSYEREAVEYFTDLWNLPTLEVQLIFPPKNVNIVREIVKKIGHPMRNSTIVNIAVYHAIMNDIKHVMVGSNHSDRVPDCSLEFWNKKQEEVRQSIGNDEFWVSAPFQERAWTKKQVVLFALENNIPYQKTRSCYMGARTPCGECGACKQRQKAMHEAGMMAVEK